MLELLKRSVKPTAFQQQVAAYPEYAAPHSGSPHLLFSADQARENLHYLLDMKASRIAILAALVKQEGITLPENLDTEDPKTLINQLHGWAGVRWAECHRKDNADRKHWLNVTNRTGDDKIYSVVMDTAIVLGELVIKHKPQFAWAVDIDPENLADGMATSNRCVLAGHLESEAAAPYLLDVEQIAAERYYDAGNIRQRHDNTWGQFIFPLMDG
ncbi:MAG: hypothetical protein KTR32_29140 [Granulosicoccus sp.]|nr:hypothetical protein [Granulosicoccus sp.]